MKRNQSVADIFQYHPDGVNLIGFPYSEVLNALSRGLAKEVLLERHQIERDEKKAVFPSFSPDYTEDRRMFFKRLPESKIATSLFEEEFPRGRYSQSPSTSFPDFCSRVYALIESARAELEDFKYLPEARRILKRMGKFDADLGETLRELQILDEAHSFAIDTETGAIMPIDGMPKQKNHATHIGQEYSRSWAQQSLFEKVKVKMKRTAIEAARNGVDSFKSRIRGFARDEFSFNHQTGNIRWNLEQLAVPVRLFHRYSPFLDSCSEQTEDSVEDESIGDEEYFPPTTKATSPEFRSHYNIQNLFPPSLLSKRGPSNFVPINFRTKRGENKFLLVGLHSGGKSFFLENIVLLSILGQIPFDMPADNLTLPKYNHLFYHRSVNNGGNGLGKWDSELQQIEGILDRGRKGDLIVFDELLDSIETGAATWLVPDLLKRLKTHPATVFVSTHRSTNYKSLEKSGWAVMSPEYEIKGGIITPTHRLQRGVPDERINRRYVRQRYDELIRRK